MLLEIFQLPNKKCSNERTTLSEMDVGALPGATECLKGSIENIELVPVAWSCKWSFCIPNLMDNWVVLAEAWIRLSATGPKRWSQEISACQALSQNVETEDGGHYWIQFKRFGRSRVRIPLQAYDLFFLEDSVNIKIVPFMHQFYAPVSNK